MESAGGCARVLHGETFLDVGLDHGRRSILDSIVGQSKDGTWDRVLRDLQYQDEEKGKFDHTVWCVDGSVVRAHVSAAGAKKGIQGIMTTKHLAGLGEGSRPSSIGFVIERGQG